MKKFIFLLILPILIFAKININEASRYELMTLAKLDAGRADMLINYRKTRAIESENQLKTITGFNGYDTKLLVENFEFKELKKEENSSKKTETQKVIQPVFIEKTKIIRENPIYKKTAKFGNIEMSETTNFPRFKDRIRKRDRSLNHLYHGGNDYSNSGYKEKFKSSINLNGYIRYRYEK